MVITKILEGTLNAGATSISFTDSDIPNSLVRIFSSKDNMYPKTRTLSGSTLTITYEAQSTNTSIAVALEKESLSIEDNLTSDSTSNALSAKQGKVLKGITDDLFQYVSNGKTLVAGAITDKGVDTPADATFADMAYNISQISGGGGYSDRTKKILVGSTVTGYNAGSGSVNYVQSRVKKVILDLWLWCPDVTQDGTVYITANGESHLITDYTYYTYTDQYHAVRRYVYTPDEPIDLTSAGYSFSGLAYNSGSQFHGEITIEYEQAIGDLHLTDLELLGSVTSPANNTTNAYTFSAEVLQGCDEILFVSGINGGPNGGNSQSKNEIVSVSGGNLTVLVQGVNYGSRPFSAGIISGIAGGITINIWHNMSAVYVSNTVFVYGIKGGD